MELHLQDRVELKKEHPCGSRTWRILRVGMDIKLKCEGCGHELTAVEEGFEGICILCEGAEG